MRTNVVIDDQLMKDALKLSGFRTKKAAPAAFKKNVGYLIFSLTRLQLKYINIYTNLQDYIRPFTQI